MQLSRWLWRTTTPDVRCPSSFSEAEQVTDQLALSHPRRLVQTSDCLLNADSGSYWRHKDGVVSAVDNTTRDVPPLLAVSDDGANYNQIGVLDKLICPWISGIRRVLGRNPIELNRTVSGLGNIDCS